MTCLLCGFSIEALSSLCQRILQQHTSSRLKIDPTILKYALDVRLIGNISTASSRHVLQMSKQFANTQPKISHDYKRRRLSNNILTSRIMLANLIKRSKTREKLPKLIGYHFFFFFIALDSAHKHQVQYLYIDVLVCCPLTI